MFMFRVYGPQNVTYSIDKFRASGRSSTGRPGRSRPGRVMQLPDEAIEFHYTGALVPLAEAWTPVAELQAKNYLRPERVDAIKQQLIQVRQQVAAERQMENPPPKLQPLDSGFIDLPGKLMDKYRRKGENSE